MAALPITTLTETYLGLTSSGKRMYSIKSIHTGTGAGAEVTATIPLTKLKRIVGVPMVTMTANAGTILYIISTTVSANTMVVTVNTDVGAVAVAFSAIVVGD